MIGFLSPRLWIALALAAALAFSHFTAYRKGKNDVRLEWQAAVSTANDDARRLEQQRQRRADDAARLGAVRESRIRADAAGARAVADGLRGDLSAALDYAAESHAAAQRVAGVAAELLGRCTTEYLGVAEAADRADSEARELRQAWPADDPPH
jgi:hypothetical protein